MFVPLVKQRVVRCLVQIKKEIEMPVEIWVLTGEFSDTDTGCIPVFSSQGYMFAVQIVSFVL